MARTKVQQVQRVNRRRRVSALWIVEKGSKILGTIERLYHGPKCYLAARQGQVFKVCSTKQRAVIAVTS